MEVYLTLEDMVQRSPGGFWYVDEKGFEIDRKKIILNEPIKALGIYSIPIKLHTEVEAKIKLWVVKE